MADIIDLQMHRGGYSTGWARCLVCNYEWIAEAILHESGNDFIACPNCNMVMAHFKFYFSKGKTHWACSCGNHLFYINENGPYCPKCGEYQYPN